MSKIKEKENNNQNNILSLYKILGIEKVSEIFSYFDDVEEYLEEKLKLITGLNVMYRYSEENKLVNFKGNKNQVGQIVNVKIIKAKTYTLEGEQVD